MEVTEHHGDGIADAGQAHLNTFLRNVALKRMRNNKNRGTENPLKVPDKKLVGGDLPGKTTSPPPTPSRTCLRCAASSRPGRGSRATTAPMWLPTATPGGNAPPYRCTGTAHATASLETDVRSAAATSAA